MLGIPYMGSKRKIAGKLVDYMLNNTPNAKYVYESHMHEVFQVAHRSELSATAKNKVTERLFCNVDESDVSKLF